MITVISLVEDWKRKILNSNNDDDDRRRLRIQKRALSTVASS